MPISYRAGDRTQGNKTLVTQSMIDAVADDDYVKIIIEEDNTERIASAINKALAKGLEMCGLKCEEYAKKMCPVDTGRLRNSITHTLGADGKSELIGTNVEYAKYVELNDKAEHRNGQAHFLHDAAANHQDVYRMILTDALADAEE